MRKLFTLLCVLAAAGLFSQATGDPKWFFKGTGNGDQTGYVTKTNSSLYSIGAGGSFALLPQSTFAAAAHTHTASQVTDFNLTGDGRWALIAHTHAAADITSGVFGTARLGTGTANSTTFLRGDGTWATPSGTGDVVGPASATDGNVPQWDGTTGKLLKNGFATTQQSTGSADGGKVVRLTAGGALYGVSDGGSNGVNGVSVTGDGVRGDSDSGDGGHFVSNSGNAVHALNTGSATAVLANAQGTGYALEAVQNNGGGHAIARFTDGADGLTIGTDGGLTWDDASGASTSRAGLGLGTLAIQNGTFSGTHSGASSGTNTGDQTLASLFLATSTTDNAIIRANGTGGGTQNSGVIIDDSNGVTGMSTLELPNTGLRLFDTDGNRYLTIAPSSNLTSPRTLSIRTGDADREIILTGDATLGSGSLSGTNTGDQTITLTGGVTGSGTGSFAATVVTNANLTGPVTSVGNATAIADAALSIAKTSGLQTAIDARLTGTAGTDIAYSGTPTYTAGAAPSGATNHHQFYTQVGNLVTWQIMLTHATTGTTVTGITATLPAEFPTPAIPTGWTGANAFLYACTPARFISTPTGSMTLNANCNLKRNAADNGFEIVATVASGSYRSVILAGSYFTN